MSELRDDVMAAVEAVRGGGGAETSGDFEADTGGGIAPGGTEGGREERAGADGAPSPQDGVGRDAAVDAGPVAGRPRDASGKFAKATEAPKEGQPKGTVAPTQGQPSTTQAPAPGAQATTPPPVTYKPPKSWRPEVSEKWASVPPEVQKEINKREWEITHELREAAQVRQFQEAWQRTLQPYEAMLRARGSNPLEAVGNTLQTLYALESAPQHLRAAKAAELIRTMGVDIGALDAALAGEQPPPQQGQPQHFDPEAIIAQAEQRVMQRFQAQAEQRMRQEVGQEVERFTAEHEFAADVAPIMSGLMQRTQGLTMEAAYEQACWAHPETRRILQQRQEAERAKATNASTQRSRLAASSVKHQPATAPVTGDEPESVLDAVRAAYKAHAGR